MTLQRSSQLVLLVALAINVAIVFLAIPAFERAYPDLYNLGNLPDYYADIAENVVAGHGYRIYPDTSLTMIREPVYVLTLAAIVSLWGKNMVAIWLANLVCLVLTGWLTIRLARRLGTDELGATIAAVGVLLHPILIAAVTRGGPECLFTLLLVAFMHEFYRALTSDRLIPIFIAGALLGVAVLTRGTVLPFTAVAAAYLAYRGLRHGRLRRGLTEAAVLCITVVVVMSPWVIRNAMLTGELVPVGSVAGDALFQGMYISKHSGTGKSHWVLMRDASMEQARLNAKAGLEYRPGFVQAFFEPRDELVHLRILMDKATEEYRADPVFFLRTVTSNLWRFWFQGRTAKSTAINAVIVLPFLLLTLVGVWIAYKRGWNLVPLGLFVGTFFAVHVAVISHARHQLPLIPFLMIFCGTALSAFAARRWPATNAPVKNG